MLFSCYGKDIPEAGRHRWRSHKTRGTCAIHIDLVCLTTLEDLKVLHRVNRYCVIIGSNITIPIICDGYREGISSRIVVLLPDNWSCSYIWKSHVNHFYVVLMDHKSLLWMSRHAWIDKWHNVLNISFHIEKDHSTFCRNCYCVCFLFAIIIILIIPVWWIPLVIKCIANCHILEATWELRLWDEEYTFFLACSWVNAKWDLSNHFCCPGRILVVPSEFVLWVSSWISNHIKLCYNLVSWILKLKGRQNTKCMCLSDSTAIQLVIVCTCCPNCDKVIKLLRAINSIPKLSCSVFVGYILGSWTSCQNPYWIYKITSCKSEIIPFKLSKCFF